MTDDKSQKKPFPESQPFEETTFSESKPFKKTSFKKTDPSNVPVDVPVGQAPDEEAVSAVSPEVAKEATPVETPRKKPNEAFLGVGVPVDQTPDQEAVPVILTDEDVKAGSQAIPLPTPPPLHPADASADTDVYIIPEIVDETLPSGNAERMDAIIIDPRSPKERHVKERRNRPPIGPPPQ